MASSCPNFKNIIFLKTLDPKNGHRVMGKRRALQKYEGEDGKINVMRIPMGCCKKSVFYSLEVFKIVSNI